MSRSAGEVVGSADMVLHHYVQDVEDYSPGFLSLECQWRWMVFKKMSVGGRHRYCL